MITKVMLHDRKSHCYYAAPGRWVKEPDQAMDFGEISMAAKAFAEEGLTYAEILIDNGALPEAPPEPSSTHKARPHHHP